MFGKTKKIVALALAGMMAVSVLAGCGSSTSSTASVTSRVAYSKADEDKIMGKEDNVSLTVWGPQAALKLLKTQCKTFTSLFPDKKITITCNADSESSAPADVLKDPTKAADVFGFVSDQLVKLYPALLAAKNTDTIKSDNVPMSVTACTYDNKIYAYPETGDNGYVLFYNKSVVSADQAKTWEDVLAACKAKSKSFMMDAGNGYYSCAFTFTGGLTFGNTDDGQTQTLSYDNTKVVNSLTAFGTLIRKYSGTFTSASVTSGVSKLQGGQAAALIDGTWDSVAIKSALGKNFAVAKLPTININGTATQTISLMGYKMLGVNKNTKYPNTAHALAQFLTDKTSQIDRVKDLGWGPSNKEAQQDPAAKNDPAIQAVQEQAQYSLPQTVMVGTFWDPMAAIGSYLITEKGNPLTPAALTKLMNDTKSAICE